MTKRHTWRLPSHAWPLLAAACGALLLACGGGGGVSTTGPRPAEFSGTASDGYRILSEFALRGRTGSPYTLTTPSNGDGRYSLRPGDLDGPFVLRALLVGERKLLHAVATAAGPLNVTPLTELVAASAIAEPPGEFYDNLDFGTSVTDDIAVAALARAESRVAAHLVLRMGIDVPASVRPFASTSFINEPSDPMASILRRFAQALSDQGVLLGDLTTTVASDAAHCRTMQLDVAQGGESDAFCPAVLGTSTDADGITTLSFESLLGDRLVLRARGAQVIDGVFHRAGTEVARCAASACGVKMGDADADDRRRIAFGGTSWSGAAALTLQGTLISGQGTLPRPCRGQRITTQDTAGSEAWLCTARSFTASRFGRVFHAFAAKSARESTLQVITEGERVVWVSLGNLDEQDQPGGGQRWRCRQPDCNGASVERAADGARTLVLSSVPLAQVRGDGLVDATETRRVSTRLPLGAPVERPARACPSGQFLELQNSDGSVQLLCQDDLLYLPGPADLDGDGNIDSFWADVQDAVWFGTWLTIEQVTLASGVPNAIFLRQRLLDENGRESVLSVQYRCTGALCTGFTVQPDGAGWTLQLDGLVLSERDPDGGLGARSLLVRGTLRDPAAAALRARPAPR